MPARNYASEEEINNIVENEAPPDIGKMMSTSLHGIFGVPYQFMDSVDRRVTGTPIGRKYSEKIISRLPLLFLTPCKQTFMEGASKSDKSTALHALITGSAGDNLSSILEGFSMYYSTELDYEAYYRYVNIMCWVVAKYLGIENEAVTIGDNGSSDGRKLRSTDWSKATNDSFKTYFSAKENVIFYLDGLNSVSESFSNSTTESSLASTINGLSDQAKELKFILGDSGALSGIVDGLGDVGSTIMSGISPLVNGVAGNILGSLTSTGVDTVLSGGKIVFPELWGDSSFDRSYSLDIKLRSPDHDSLSIYLNILVPYIHLLALVLPRGLDGTTDSATVDPNGYTSPFLVRAYCKGLFNIDMGLVTGLDVTKGAECCWNDEGLPTQIDISLTIKDLYSTLFMTSLTNSLNPLKHYDSIKAIVTNTFMMDFLANMAGLNVGQLGMGRKTTLFNYLTFSDYSTIGSRKWTSFEQAISNLMDGLYNLI